MTEINIITFIIRNKSFFKKTPNYFLGKSIHKQGFQQVNNFSYFLNMKKKERFYFVSIFS